MFFTSQIIFTSNISHVYVREQLAETLTTSGYYLEWNWKRKCGWIENLSNGKLLKSMFYWKLASEPPSSLNAPTILIRPSIANCSGSWTRNETQKTLLSFLLEEIDKLGENWRENRSKTWLCPLLLSLLRGGGGELLAKGIFW